MRSKALLAASWLLTAVFAFLWFTATQKLNQSVADSASLRAASKQLEADLAAAQASLLPDSEISRLKEIQLEAIQLRGQVAGLKRSVTEAEQARDAAQKTAAAAKAAVAANAARPPASAAQPEASATETVTPGARILNSKASARIPSGHAVALGGWASSPGKRAFALVSPTADPASGGVTVETSWIELSDEAASRIQLDSLVNRSGSQFASLTAEQFAAALSSLAATAGVDLLAAPKVSTASGRAAGIAVTQRRDTPGRPVDFGPKVQVVPTSGADGALDISIDATYTVPDSPPPSNP